MISMSDMLRQAARDTAQSQSKPPIREDQTLFAYAADYIDIALDLLEKDVKSRHPTGTDVRAILDEKIRNKIDATNKNNNKLLVEGPT